MKKWLVIGLTLLAALGIIGAGGAPRVAVLSGANEVPSADPDGSGFAAITLNVGQGQVCWDIWFQDITAPSAAHIHRAPAGQNGPVVVPLNPNSPGCNTADPYLIQEIIDYPDQFYVNVHNSVYPGGAIRGQLSNRGQSK
jgi:hypothetical protein